MLQCTTACTPPRCDEPETRVSLAGVDNDPILGVYEGKLLWLQTLDETVIRLTLLPRASSATLTCGSGTTELNILTSTSDNVVDASQILDASITAEGYVQLGAVIVQLNPRTLTIDGKVPDAPGIFDRMPTATLTLTRQPSGGWEGEIQMVSTSDKLHLAMATLEKVAS